MTLRGFPRLIAGGNPHGPRSRRGRVRKPQTSHENRPPESRHSGESRSPGVFLGQRSLDSGMRRNDVRGLDGQFSQACQLGYRTSCCHRKVTTELQGCVTSLSNKGDSSCYGYRFIWRDEDGNLRSGAGKTRLHSLTLIRDLLRKAEAAGWRDHNANAVCDSRYR